MINIKSVLGDDSSICLVVFSPLDALKKSKESHFGWWNQLESMPYSKVFVKDSLNTWYLTLNGEDLDVDGIAIKLNNEIESVCNIKNTRLIFLGPSMGGFGAFLYGSILGADLCWATSVTNTLMHPGSTSSIFLKDPKFKISLNSYLNENTMYQMYIGDLNIFDLYSASLFPDNVEISMLSNSGHVVPQELKNRGVSINNIVESLIKGFKFEDINSRITFDEIRNEVFFYFMVHQENQLALEKLLYSSSLYENDFLLFKIIEAKGLYKLGEKVRALEIIEKNILTSNYRLDWGTYHFIGLVYRDLKDFSKAMFFFKKSLDLNPDSRGNKDQINLLKKRVESSLELN